MREEGREDRGREGGKSRDREKKKEGGSKIHRTRKRNKEINGNGKKEEGRRKNETTKRNETETQKTAWQLNPYVTWREEREKRWMFGRPGKGRREKRTRESRKAKKRGRGMTLNPKSTLKKRGKWC